MRPERSDKEGWAKWVAYCHENSPDKVLAAKPHLGKPYRVHTWCPECSSTSSDTFNWHDVYLFSSRGARIKCVQCLGEWFGRHGIK